MKLSQDVAFLHRRDVTVVDIAGPMPADCRRGDLDDGVARM
jgi:hypothetical protein